jgi:TatD DNase family protein
LLIDSHAHLADRRLAADIGGVVARARGAGVVGIVAPSTTAEDAPAVVGLAQAYTGVIFGAVAIHPNDAAEARPGDWEAIVELSDQPGVVAIGETGLDRYWKRTPFEQQQEMFDRHLELARHRNLPVIIHCRDCYADVIEQLSRQPRPVSGVLHSFTGTVQDAEALLALGLHISFAGMITFANKALDPLREAAASIPDDRLLVETDSPYLSPHPFRGKPNEPARVAITAAYLAELRGVTPDHLARLTTENARRLFCLEIHRDEPSHQP